MMRVVRTASRWWLLGPALAIYTAAWLAPATLWFDSRSITVSDTVVGQVPVVTEDRAIRWSFYGEFFAAVRRVGDDGATACSGSGVRRYIGGQDGFRATNLIDWADNNPSCAWIPAGTYYLDTCRTVLRPLLGIIPAKTACWRSGPFTVREVLNK
jgi:hypothetical protein